MCPLLVAQRLSVSGHNRSGTLEVMRVVTIEWGDGLTGHLVEGARTPGILLAHGAGAGQDHPGVTALRDGLSSAGFPVLTFAYPYMERGSRRPDRAPTLLAAHAAAADWFRRNVTERIVFAGRSMGGRIASMLVAQGERADGLILYAYPLHPPGRYDRLRVEHLPQIEVPMLFFTGTRDAFARSDLVDAYLRPLPHARVELIEGADHGFTVLKRSGLTKEAVMDEIVRKSTEWIAAL